MGTVRPLPQEKQFTVRRPSSCTRRCSVRLASIAEYSSLLPPVGVWAVLNPSVADRPLRPAIDRRLGELLPHQLANRPRAPPKAPLAELSFPSQGRLCGLVGDFSPVFLTSGQVTHVLLTRPPLPPVPKNERTFDLHVLGTPPAFVLSQDQTRHSMYRSDFSARSRHWLLSCDPGQELLRCILGWFADVCAHPPSAEEEPAPQMTGTGHTR